MQDGMAEATRLTRQGRLAEATAIVQRTLGGTFEPGSSDGLFGSTNEPTEATFVVADEAPQPTAPSRPTPTEHGLRPAPKPPRRFRNMPRRPGGLSGTGSEETTGKPSPVGATAGGRFVERSYTNQVGTRAYKLYIPSGYTGQAVPLVVMLHGCTQNPDDFAAGTQMNALAEKHTCLVAYPAQAATANSTKCWNWFEAAEQQRGRGEPSLIAGITCEVVGEYHVATDQVYLAGMSDGRAMAAIVGAAYPDLYAAIGIHPGLAPGAAHDLSSAFAAMRHGGSAGTRRSAPTGESTRIVPAIVFHGDRDATVHPRNADHLLAYWVAADGRDTTNGSTPRVTKRQGQVPDGHAYTCITYHDAGDQVIMEQWNIHGLGHAWSGGSYPGSYVDPKGPEASMEMARFFLEHSRRGDGGASE